MRPTRVTTRVVTGAVAVLLCAMGARSASALVACTSGDIIAQDGTNCPSGTGPCTIKKDFDIPNGCTINFTGRDVTLANLAVLSISNGGSVTFKARNFTGGAGGYIDGRGTSATPPDDAGAFISIQTTQAVSVLKTSLTGRIEVSASTTPGSIEIIAGTSVTVQGRLEADSLGSADGGLIDVTAGTDIISVSGSDISAVGAGGGVGGEVDLSAGGKVDLGATVDLDGYDGGNLSIDSGAESKLSAVNQKGTGFGSSMVIEAGLGGTLDVLAGTFVQILGRITATGTGGGCGGDISIEADFGAITVSEQILAEASLPEATETGAGGGAVTLNAVGPIVIQSTGKVSARSDGTLGYGGAICIETDDSLTASGAIDSSGGQCGGTIDISAQANVTFSNLVSAAARNFGGFGGTITTAAGDFGKGTLTINSTVDVTGGACNMENGCGVAGSTDLSGCDVTVSSTGHVDARAPGGSGSNLLTAREQLRIQGPVEAQATDVTGINGTNEFTFPIPKPPIVTASVNPAATLTARTRCIATGVPDAFCLPPCPTCGNGIVEFPETCDNNVGIPMNCDGCTRYCQAENCNDGNDCSTDSCDPTLGCRNVLMFPCITPTPSGPSPTPTSTPTRTNTPLPAASPTVTSTPSVTPTRTNTPTPTNTATFTNTPTSTPTSTSTFTPTITPTFTNTPTSTITPTFSPTLPPTVTPTGPPPPTPTMPVTRIDDSVVLPVKPVSVTIPLAQAEVQKLVKVKVVNADILPSPETDGHPIKLIAHLGDCPAAVVVGQPDFDIRTPGDQDTILLRGGRSKKAVIRLRLQSSAFTSFNRITATRCTLQLEAKTDLAGSGDPTPDNNVVPLEVSVIDRNDPDQSTLHESAIDSSSPMTFTLRKGRTTLRKIAKPRVLNGNLTAIVAHAISVTASGSCPAAVMNAIDFDSRTAGTQSAAAAPGGKVRGAMDVNANAVDFTSPNKKSPGRCVVVFTAMGPSGDTDATNNVTRMVVDVVDKNDF